MTAGKDRRFSTVGGHGDPQAGEPDKRTHGERGSIATHRRTNFMPGSTPGPWILTFLCVKNTMSDTKRKPFVQMREDLRETQAVRLMCHRLGVRPNELIGALHEVWRFANRALGPVSDRAEFTFAADIDRLADIPGFSKAMEEAGWLVVGETWIEFPGYNEGPGSRARHELEARKRTAAATAKRAAIVAARERDQGPTLFDDVEDVESPAPPVAIVANIVTMNAMDPNGNGNGKEEKEPPLSPPSGGTKNPLPDFAKATKRQRAQLERLEALAELIGSEHDPGLARTWRDWLGVCLDLGHLPARAMAETIAAELIRAGPGLAAQTLRDWIRRGRYTPPDGFWGAKDAPGRPPRPNGEGVRMWEQEFEGQSHWLATDAIGRLWWNPTAKRWDRVRDKAGSNVGEKGTL